MTMTQDDVAQLIHAHVPAPMILPATEDEPARVLCRPDGAESSHVFVITVTGPYDTDKPEEIAELAADVGLAIRDREGAEVQPTQAEATAPEPIMHNPVYSLCVPCHTRKKESPEVTVTGDLGTSG